MKSLLHLACAALALLAAPASAQTATKVEKLAEMPGKSPEGAGWGADGALYLSSVNTFEVLRYKDGKVEDFAKLPIHTLVVTAGPDELAVNGHIDVDRTSEAAMVGAGRVVTLDYTGKIKKVIHVGSLPNGITHYKGHIYFASDTNEGKIWRIDSEKGEASVWMDDPLFKRAPDDRRAGINGVRVHGNYLYFASTARESIYRVKIGKNGKPASKVLRVGSAHYADDFDVAKDGTVYVATRNAIAKISPKGETTDLTDGSTVEGGPSLVLAPDEKSLIAVTQGRIMRPAWGPPGKPETVPAPQSSEPAVPKLLRVWLP